MNNLSEHNQNRIFSYYKKVAIDLSTEIIDIISKSDHGIPPSLDLLHKSMSDLANKYSAKYLTLNRGKMDESQFEALDNLIREHLLDLSSKTDFIPTEDFISTCGQEIATLVYFTKTLLHNQQDEED